MPDIASNAINYQTWINTSPALICGSSGRHMSTHVSAHMSTCMSTHMSIHLSSGSAPSTAGMITAINAARSKQKLPRLGFLNPLLYKHPEALNDISHGFNNCTAVVTSCCKQGFTGASGWDPLVGLGSPSYTRLLHASGADA